MADLKPNYELERQRLDLEREQLKFNIKSQSFRIAQIEDEKQRIQQNITATTKAIADLDDQISKIKEN